MSRFNQNARFDKNLYNLQCCAKDFSTVLFCLLKEAGNVDIIRTENKFSGGFYVLLSRNL